LGFNGILTAQLASKKKQVWFEKFKNNARKLKELMKKTKKSTGNHCLQNPTKHDKHKRPKLPWI